LTKPSERLRWQLLPATRQQEQLVELVQQDFGSSFFIGQRFPRRAPNLPLDTVLVKTAKECLDWWAKIYPMRIKGAILLKARVFHGSSQRSDLNVSPVFPP